MIPKVIHYCWFGGNPLPDNLKKYIKTWREQCPDYELLNGMSIIMMLVKMFL